MPVRQISKIVMRSLFSEPATRMYPIQKRDVCSGARGHIAIRIEACIFCGLCGKKCPTAAIRVSRDNKSWEIDRLKCITCNACVESCPKKCLAMEKKHAPSQTHRHQDVFRASVAPSTPAE